MLDIDNLIKYDKSKMHEVYDRWPQIAEEFYKKNFNKVDFKGLEHIVFVGMGGSGALGDTLSSILSKTNIHLCVVKGYHLPKTADSHTLVVASSVSGNTVETLTVLNTAKKIGCKIIGFSSGGKMEKYCIKNSIEHRNIPILNSPRASFPAYLYSMLNVLENIIPIKKTDIKRSILDLHNTRARIYSQNFKNNPSMELAEWIKGIPIMYYPNGLSSVSIRFKNSLQENAKMHMIIEDVMEACHNSIVSWERPSQVRPILLQGQDDYIKTKQLWKIIKEYFDSNNIPYKEIYSIKGNILTKIINLIYLLDYSSIYHAVIKKIDPTPTHSIDFIKERLH